MNHQFHQMYNRLATGLLFPMLVVVLGFNFIVSQALAETETKSSSEEGTVTSVGNSTNSTLEMDKNINNNDEKGGSNAGLIAGLIVPIVVLIAIVVVLFVIHKRRSRMMDNEKKMKIQMTSARNAGVYQDLTVTDAEKPPPSPEHEHLQSTEEV